MDDGVGVTEEETDGSMVDANTPVLTEVVEGSMVDVNTPVVEMVAEGVGVMLKSTNIIYYQYLFFKILLRRTEKIQCMT